MCWTFGFLWENPVKRGRVDNGLCEKSDDKKSLVGGYDNDDS
jgi:hypothetical protein